MTWKKAASIATLEKKPVIFKSSPKQIALFLVSGKTYAVDNRCPHEGYPLAAGYVDEDCVLTCNWHNWKFRLRDGECVLGGDNVRAYPTKVKDGNVWVNIQDPSPQEMEGSIVRGLEVAFNERDYGRICREIARLHYNRLDPMLAIRKALEWSHDKLEFGYTHAFAASADWLARHKSHEGDQEKQLVCLAEAVDHMAFDSLRRPDFPFAAAGEGFDHGTFVAAVEAEQREDVEAMMRRGLKDGLHWKDMEEAFVEAALAHYNNFGHSLIYVYKTSQFLELVSEKLEPNLLLPLSRHLCYTTREDLLAEFKEYRSTLAEMTEPAQDDASPLDAADLFPATTRQAFGWLLENSSSHRALTLYDVLLDAVARNLLHYDTRYEFAFDLPVSQNATWLNFTHGITFANAVRNVCAKYPRFWRQGLLQVACFLGRNRRFIDHDLDERPWLDRDRDEFLAEIHLKILDHGLRDPIFSAHLLKTARAVEEELPHASDSCERYLLAGLNRFFSSRLKQKHTRRLAAQAIDLVRRDFPDVSHTT